MTRKGFTLIELLVVIAIIALLLSIVMPGLNMVKKKAASIACLSNARQMSISWYMYQEENDSKIMRAVMENVGTQNECKLGWIGQPHTANDTTSSSLSMTQTSPAVTDEDEIRGASKGKLYPYMENPDVYHCPADKLRMGPDGTKLYVSYAIARCLYGDPITFQYQITRFTNITSPSRRYNFVENGEANRGNWNMGGRFPIASPEWGAPGYGLWGPVAISHGDSNIFGFVDGHAEVKKWHDTAIFDHYKATENQPPGSNYGHRMAPGSEDVAWLGRGWAYRYKGP